MTAVMVSAGEAANIFVLLSKYLAHLFGHLETPGIRNLLELRFA
jgi:hypothetical protein